MIKNEREKKESEITAISKNVGVNSNTQQDPLKLCDDNG
jgi:hypothetical protein